MQTMTIKNITNEILWTVELIYKLISGVCISLQVDFHTTFPSPIEQTINLHDHFLDVYKT